VELKTVRTSPNQATKKGYRHGTAPAGVGGNTGRALSRVRRALGKKRRFVPDALGVAPGKPIQRAVYKKDARLAREAADND